MDINTSILQAWERRDKYQGDSMNIIRIANAYNLSEAEVKKIIQSQR